MIEYTIMCFFWIAIECINIKEYDLRTNQANQAKTQRYYIIYDKLEKFDSLQLWWENYYELKSQN